MIPISTPSDRTAADFLAVDIEQRHDVKAVAVEAAVIGESHAEVAGTDDDDAARAVDAQRLDQLLLEFGDVVANARVPNSPKHTRPRRRRAAPLRVRCVRGL